MKASIEKKFAAPLLTWYQQAGRHTLPWKNPITPYRVWISEIMLQQTQVQTVIPYFERFMATFPTVEALANAKEDAVLALWSGLGYYSRARNLHKAAQTLKHHFPQDIKVLQSLAGIGKSTAAAIASQAFNLPTPILDANVKRVLSRFFKVEGFIDTSAIEAKLWQFAALCMPEEACADYTQAIMDLGATVCTSKKPSCIDCPVAKHCLAFKANTVLAYPQKKPKKIRPEKKEIFLILRTEKSVYLEKRPAKGIWGGLWSFPTLDASICPYTFIKDNYKEQYSQIREHQSFKHQFTHFSLEIAPIECIFHTENTSEGWFSKDMLTELGLAKPTSKILESILP